MGQKWTLESAYDEKAPGLHPFAGARLRVFLRHALLTSGLDPRTRYQRFIGWVAQGLRFPLVIIEKVKYGGRIKRAEFKGPPVFLIGHWRSGTTHLHNLMSRDPQFGFIKFTETAMPLDMLGPKVRIARKIIDRALPEDRGFDKVRLTLDEPQEEEMGLGNLNPIGYYNIYCFPEQMEYHRDRALFFDGCTVAEKTRFRKNYDLLIRKLNYAKGDKRLLLKNPPSTTRMEMILEMYPDAKFVHIVRNPWEVYCSTRSHFGRVFNAFAWQDFRKVDIREYTLTTYEKLMRRYLEDRDRLKLPESQLVETTYEAITENPEEEIGRIYDALGIQGKGAGLSAISDYLKGLGNYKRNVHHVDEGEAEEIRKRWGFSFKAWGYKDDLPESVAVK
ncbi:sulfotransferase [Verrucomicrobiales bacterium BCK34]|nr:sulfotransferase [Verrucomicrobiales bacterium BCK34]